MNENDKKIVDWEEKFKNSGMTIEEWNASILSARDEEIAKKVEAVRQEKLAIEQKTNFIVNEIMRAGHEHASKIIADAKQQQNSSLNNINSLQSESVNTITNNNFSDQTKAWVESSRKVIDNAMVEAEKKYNEFIAARENQRQQDKILREQQLSVQKQVNTANNESIGGISK